MPMAQPTADNSHRHKVVVADGVQHVVVLAHDEQNERAGNARQDHGADGDHAGEEQIQRTSASTSTGARLTMTKATTAPTIRRDSRSLADHLIFAADGDN